MESKAPNILVTGAAGAIGRTTRPALLPHAGLLRSSDIAPMEPVGGPEECLHCDLRDYAAGREAARFSLPARPRAMNDLLDPSLKGKVGILDPSMYTCLPYVSMALEFGGDEYNMEPGWEFLRKLAESGNVGQVLKCDVDSINAMTAAAIAVTYTGIGNWGRIAASVPTAVCNRMDESNGMKAFLFTVGWTIINGPRVEEAKRFASYLLRPDINEAYAHSVTAAPANRKAKAAEEFKELLISTEEDIARYGYFPDFPHIAAQIPAWTQRFETEIMPIIRGR